MNINISTGGYRNNNYNNYNNRYNRHSYRQGPRTVHMINKPWQRILFNLAFIVVGVIIIIFGISSSTNSNSDNFVETTATVIDYDYDYEGLAAIIVEYTVNDQKYQDKSDYKSNNPKSIGSSVQIKYNPDNPNEVIWNNGFSNLIIIIMGTIFIILGGIGSYKSIKDGLTEGFDSGTNTKVRYDAFGNIISDDMNGPSRFDYSNQENQNINNPYAMNNTYSEFDSNNQNMNNSSDFVNDQNINNPYASNNNHSDFNQNNIDQNNNNF